MKQQYILNVHAVLSKEQPGQGDGREGSRAGGRVESADLQP